jgi:hypothetical protein
MNDTQPPMLNGAAGPAQQDSRSIGAHARQIQHDAASLAAEVRGATADLERYVTDQVNQQPYGTLVAAVAAGYVLGGGLSSRLTLVLLGALARLGTALAAREVAARMSPVAPTNVWNKNP